MTGHRVLLVCSGNTCRSPMAAAILRAIWDAEGKPWPLAIASAGTGAFPGGGATDHAIETMKARGLDLSGHTSQTVTDASLAGADIVLAMTQRHKDYILALWPEVAGRVFTLGEFAGTGQEVQDPFGGSLAQYQQTAAELEAVLRAVAARIRREGTSVSMKVAVGSDHGGIDLKQAVIAALQELHLEVVDMGTHDRASCDYPDYAQKVAEAVVSGRCQQGVLVCGTGIGMSIAANKVKGIRAALCNEIFSAKMARGHNDANILCLGARVVGPGVAKEIIAAYFTGSFEGGRHAQRVDKLNALDNRK